MEELLPLCNAKYSAAMMEFSIDYGKLLTSKVFVSFLLNRNPVNSLLKRKLKRTQDD